MDTHPKPDDSPQTAEDWLARLLSTHCSPRDRAAFEDWLAASPANITDYARIECIHGLGAAQAGDRLLVEAAKQARRETATMRSRPSWRHPWALAAAASLLVALGGGAWLMRGPAMPDQHYVTRIGEQRTLTLVDGSTLALDTNSRVAVSFTRDTRRIELEHGRLQVQVAHDAARPLVVHAGSGTVRALGTVFQVGRVTDEVVVGLLEGKVEVSTGEGDAKRTRNLLPGQRIAYGPDGAISAPEPLDAEVARAWVNGELVFKDRRLRDLLEDFNRYSTTRFVLADPELGELRMSGIFRADDPQALLDTLREGWALQARRTDTDEITLAPADHQ